jgi:hypothetical protein
MIPEHLDVKLPAYEIATNVTNSDAQAFWNLYWILFYPPFRSLLGGTAEGGGGLSG